MRGVAACRMHARSFSAKSPCAIALNSLLRGTIVKIGPTVHTKTYTRCIFLYFYQQYLVLFYYGPRVIVVPDSPSTIAPPLLYLRYVAFLPLCLFLVISLLVLSRIHCVSFGDFSFASFLFLFSRFIFLIQCVFFVY